MSSLVILERMVGVGASFQSVVGEGIDVSSWNVVAGGHRSACQRGERPERLGCGISLYFELIQPTSVG